MLYVHCEATLRPMLDVWLGKKRHVAGGKAEHEEMRLMHHMLISWVTAQ